MKQLSNQAVSNRILVLGPSYIDIHLVLEDPISLDGTSRVKEIVETPGGTGLCYASALANLENNVSLATVLGNDHSATSIHKFLTSEGITPMIQFETQRTDFAYILVDNHNHKTAASHRTISDLYDVAQLDEQQLTSFGAVVITSFSNHIVKNILDKLKSQKSKNMPFVMWAPHVPNCLEASLIINRLKLIDHITLSKNEYNILENKIGNPLRAGVKSITITDGKNGSILRTNSLNIHIDCVNPIDYPANTNGAGEAFGAGFLSVFLNTHDYQNSTLAGNTYAYEHVQNTKSLFPKGKIAKLIEFSTAFQNNFNLSYEDQT